MCIALLSTAHPSYQLILIDNRDEYITRPTAPAEWWPNPNSNVLGGRDLLREVQGTWLGITKTGKISVLTNYREDVRPTPTAVSRGAIIRKFLTEDVGPIDDFVKEVVNTGVARDAGGFSLVCGHVGEKLAIISNRAESQSEVPWIVGDVVQTVALSNTAFTDRSWKKVTMGEELMLNTIRGSQENNEDEDQLVERFMELLSHDTLGLSDEVKSGEMDTYVTELRNSIFIPPVGKQKGPDLDEDEMRASKNTDPIKVVDPKKDPRYGLEGIYATQKQTVILVDRDFNVRYVERTLFDDDANPIPIGKGDADFSFQIER